MFKLSIRLPSRNIPLVQVNQNCLFWLTFQKQNASKKVNLLKRMCLISSRQRSVNRLTGTARSTFRRLALKGWCSGLIRSSW